MLYKEIWLTRLIFFLKKRVLIIKSKIKIETFKRDQRKMWDEN